MNLKNLKPKWSCQIVCFLLFFGASNQELSGRNKLTTFVTASPINKYEYRIYNTSPLDFYVKISGLETLRLPRGKTITLPSHTVKAFTTFELIYDSLDYAQVKKTVEAKMDRLELEKELSKMEFEVQLEAAEELFKKEPLIRGGLGGIIVKNKLDKDKEIALSEYNNSELRSLNEAVYYASSKANGGKYRYRSNRYKSDFEPKLLKPHIRSKVGLSKNVKVEGAWLISQNDLNEFWVKESGDLDWGITLTQGIGSEIRLGKSKRFIKLYGFGAWNKESYGLSGEGVNSYFVDSSYVKFSERSNYNLITTEVVNLNIYRWSAGLIVENYFYPDFFYNLRVGYNVVNAAHIEFEGTKGEQNIFHLENPFEFNERKNNKVIDFGNNKFYGAARIGFYLGKGYYATLGYEVRPKSNFLFGEGHGLFYNNQNALQKVPINKIEEKKFHSQFTWSFGVAL